MESARQTVSLLAGKWRILILCSIHKGLVRPGELIKEIPQLSKKVLHSEIKSLTKYNLIYRVQKETVTTPWVEYHLTPLGLNLFQVIEQLSDWGTVNAALLPSPGYTDKVNIP